MNIPKSFSVELPAWIASFSPDILRSESFLRGEVQAQMRFLLEILDRHITEKTGGPFASGIFTRDSGELIALGLNLVVSNNNPILHGEMVALALASAHEGSYSLSLAKPGKAYRLLTTAQPCAMCVGAVVWGGIHEIVCAARASDVEKLTGFDEGPIHPQWQSELRARGISVVEDVERERACELLERYRKEGGVVYNGPQ